MSQVMITVNGKEMPVPGRTTVRQLIELMGLGQGAVAAEVNQVLVPRREHEARVLEAGDRVELVTLVGGG